MSLCLTDLWQIALKVLQTKRDVFDEIKGEETFINLSDLKQYKICTLSILICIQFNNLVLDDATNLT